MEIQGWPKTCTLTLPRPPRRWRSLAEIPVSISAEYEIFGMSDTCPLTEQSRTWFAGTPRVYVAKLTTKQICGFSAAKNAKI